jgi:ribosomal protein S18 acetylase RimI-like enzyme
VEKRGTIRLRPYTAEDFEAIFEVDQLCYTPDVAYSREDLTEYLKFPNADCIVALDGDKIAGFCLTAHRREQGYIVTIDVLESYRRHRVGTLLLDECEKRMWADGVRIVNLETATDNDAAIAFWKKHGYRTRTIRKEYYPGGQDAFAMRKTLEPKA